MNDLISRQAAIDALKVAYWDDNIQSAKDDPCIVDAMTDWAIRQVKALPSAQPTQKNYSNSLDALDCVSRQAAIDALYHVDEYNGRSVEAIRNLPSAQSERWIPCGERLPEEDGYYLVTNSKWGAPWREITLWVTDGWSSDNKPIAWMPLPEPYEERREDV